MLLLVDTILFGIIASYMRRTKDIWYLHYLARERRYYYKDRKNRWRCNGLLDSFQDEPTIVTSKNNQLWYKNGLLHRDHDKPAFVSECDNFQKWFQYGKRHRDNDLPAVIGPWKFRKWYQHGLLHRDHDKPAIITGDMNIQLADEDYGAFFCAWYQHGLCHRDGDRPAVDGGRNNFYFEWFQHGKRRRDDKNKPLIVYKRQNTLHCLYEHDIK